MNLRRVPTHIVKPEYVGKRSPSIYQGSDVQSVVVIEKMKIAGTIAADAMHLAGKSIKPGMTTDQLDEIVHEYICDQGAYPSTLGYRGFPKSLCTSINEVICHGIPSNQVIKEGDIINLDVTAFKDGVHGDTNYTFLVGVVEEEVKLLVERTKESLDRAIQAVAPGRPINVIGRVIESYAKRFNYGVVRDFTGHGVHTHFHSGLVIPHYDDPTSNQLMQEGMTFTIEPMLNLGTHDYDMLDDGWTVLTKDRKISAQFEHTLVVKKLGQKS